MVLSPYVLKPGILLPGSKINLPFVFLEASLTREAGSAYFGEVRWCLLSRLLPRVRRRGTSTPGCEGAKGTGEDGWTIPWTFSQFYSVGSPLF